MAPFKDEHILIIAPGSQTTLAQLGLPESFTPARFRLPTRMFPTEKPGEWEPYKVREKRVPVKKLVRRPKGEAASAGEANIADRDGGAAGGRTKEDAEMKDADFDKESEMVEIEEEQVIFEEDPSSDEGAVYPMRGGAVVDWPCLLALLTHVYNTLNPPFHAPVLVLAEPVWTLRDRELVTQFIFEKFKSPAFCLMDTALAVCYAYGVPTATVIDVGQSKTDVTAISDFVVHHLGRGLALPGGGDALTDRLAQLLAPRGFSRDMCEQLKRSNICEVLPPGVPLPGPVHPAHHQQQEQEQEQEQERRQKEHQQQEREQLQQPQQAEKPPPGAGAEGAPAEDEGVLDVAAIVTGDTNQFLTHREQEQEQERAAAAKKGAAAAASAAAQQRLPNSKREKATFVYHDYVRVPSPSPAAGVDDHYVPRQREMEVGVERFMALTAPDGGDGKPGMLDTLAAQIYHTIQSTPEAGKRSELWDSLIVMGNGSKLKGFTQTLLHALNQRYTLYSNPGLDLPSSSTMPTPLATGTNTPAPTNPYSASASATPAPSLPPSQAQQQQQQQQPQQPQQPQQQQQQPNPLLVAATHAQHQSTQQQQQQQLQHQQYQQQQHQQQHLQLQLHQQQLLSGTPMPPNNPADPAAMLRRATGHAPSARQTPTSVRVLRAPDYFPEWKPSAQVTAAAQAQGAGVQVGAAGGSDGTGLGVGGAGAGTGAGTGAGMGIPGLGGHGVVGMEEAMFLGAQVGAKVVFMIDQGLSKGFMSRVDYNEMGPTGIHECGL